MPTKKKSSKAESATDLARKHQKTKAALKRQQAVLKKILQLLHATERLVKSISTPPPSTSF
jgi:hypothetical protein